LPEQAPSVHIATATPEVFQPIRIDLVSVAGEDDLDNLAKVLAAR
jgi:hypothetical protein